MLEAILALCIAGFLVTYLLIPLISSYMRSRGIVGIDVHKLSKPEIPEMGGLSILAGITAAAIMGSYLFPEFSTTFFAFLFTILIAGTVGIIDDIRGLHPVVKPVLTLFASLPILLFHAYSEYPILPFAGRARLTMIYPLLIPIGIAVTANAVNMLDPLNGVMSGTSAIIASAFLICSLLFNRFDATILSLALLGVLLAFYAYNKYPARVFPGDTGSLAVGAGIGALAIIGSMEVIGVVLLLPHIMNAFYILSGLKKLSRHELWARPIQLLEGGELAATDSLDAPITLTRMILAEGPISEQRAIKVLFSLTAFCSFLALITALIMMALV